MTPKTLGFIGGGNMASSLIGGLVASSDGLDPKAIWVFDPNEQAVDSLIEQFGVNRAEDNQQLVEKCDAVVLAVKPQILAAVLAPISSVLSSKKPLIISVVAGITSDTIEKWVGEPISIVRVMPNTPALIGLGASGLFANQNTSTTQKEFSNTLVNAVGMGEWVTEESHIDSVTALSGSGPAYFMLFIKSLIDAGISNGLDPEGAKRLAVQTAIGAAELIKQSDQGIQQLIDNVTSPKGTTEQALFSFHDNELPRVVAEAFLAAKTRSEQMADELSS